MLAKINKPLSTRARRNLRRIKTLTIAILCVIIVAEVYYRKQNEAIYKEQIVQYKETVEVIEREMGLIRNSIPIDIKLMGQITNATSAIQQLKPEINVNTAEYYASAIVKEANKYENINEYMLIALIRQESYFVSDDTSWVGARGLGQIMPTTAKYIVEDKWKVPYDDSMLFDPQTNIQIAAWYLSDLMNNYKNFKVALAYYNGGHWQAKRYQVKLRKDAGSDISDEDAEQLVKLHPETADYVPKVYGYYQQLKGFRNILEQKKTAE